MSLWYYTPARTAVPGVLEYDIRAPSAAEDEACYNLRLDSKLKEKRTQDSALCLAEDNYYLVFLFLKFLLIVCDILVGLHIFTTKNPLILTYWLQTQENYKTEMANGIDFLSTTGKWLKDNF